MHWQSTSELAPGRLAFLRFDQFASGQWVGYVDENGVCEWPDKVRGLRPSGWQEVAVDPDRLEPQDN
jgi:hypothetical protein